MASEPIVPYSLDDYFQSTPIGSLDKAIGNNLFGINHQQVPGLVPSNKDVYGLTFFVRPQLNMQKDNLRNVRKMSPLLTDNLQTLQAFVRCTLDPRLQSGYSFVTPSDSGVQSFATINCPIVDPLQAFIPILGNNLNSISGWPDLTLDAFTSKPGLHKEVYSQVDSISENYEAYNLDASFRNTRGDPILYLFYIWMHYASHVFRGSLVPYMDFISENEIDYNTRIYRLILDQNKEYVKKIAATGVAFPLSIPTGSFFDYTSEKPYNDQNKDITIRFQALGFETMDDILIKEFNDTVSIFNPNMRDSNRSSSMTLLTKNLVGLFNNRGYPRINPTNNALEWWVPNDLFTNRTEAFVKSKMSSSEELDPSAFISGIF